jgi:co-chaperonin GroES (HSP10)
MSNKKRTDTTNPLHDGSIIPTADNKQRLDLRKVRKINPLGMRVLVQLRRESNQTDGGLYLPEGAKQNMQESVLAEVLEVASASEAGSDEEHNVSGIPHGALVLIPKDAGVKVAWDENLRIIETREVLAIVSEISLS